MNVVLMVHSPTVFIEKSFYTLNYIYYNILTAQMCFNELHFLI